MPYYTDSPIGADAGLQDLPSSLGMSVGAAVDDAFTSNPTKVIYDYTKFSRANDGPKLDKAEAEGRVKQAGVSLKVPDAGYSEEALNLLIDRKREEVTRQSILARAPSGIVPSTTRFAASLLTGVLDPLNVAASFVPVVGEARYAEMLAQASGALGRAGVRAGVGAAEGLVGSALVEPINYFGRTQMQDDYHMSDSLLNLAMGAGLGGVLHTGGGAIGDKLGISDFARARELKVAEDAQAARMRAEAGKPDEPISIPGLSEKQAAAIDRVHQELGTGKYEPGSAAARAAEMTPEGRDASMRVAVAQAMEGRIPDVDVISAADRAANLREFMAGSKVVGADGQPLVVFHGTKAEFDRFDLKKAGASDEGLAGKGFYFTYNPEEASGYALNEHFGKGEAPNVQSAYVAIKNPLVITQGVLPDGRKVSDLHGGIGIKKEGGEALRKLADDAGHDGVMWVSRDGEVRHAVAFRPEQIKSAIGNSGRFDPGSPSLTDPIGTARATAERQAAPESVAVADFNASRAADERIAAEPKTDPAQVALDTQAKKLDDLLKNLEQRGLDPKRIDALRAELAPFDEALADSKKLGDAMKAAAVCGIA